MAGVVSGTCSGSGVMIGSGVGLGEKRFLTGAVILENKLGFLGSGVGAGIGSGAGGFQDISCSAGV
jgi:hypothetical protein